MSNLNLTVTQNVTELNLTITQCGYSVTVNPIVSISKPYDDTAIQAEVDLNTLKETNIAHPVVEKAVPSDALFTDTVYNDTAIQASVLANTTAIGDIDTAIDIINGQII